MLCNGYKCKCKCICTNIYISGRKDVETTFIHFRRKPHVSVNGDCSYSQDAIVDDDGFAAQAWRRKWKYIE